MYALIGIVTTILQKSDCCKKKLGRSQASIYNLYSKLHILLASVLPTALGHNLQTVFTCCEFIHLNRTGACNNDTKLSADENGMDCIMILVNP